MNFTELQAEIVRDVNNRHRFKLKSEPIGSGKSSVKQESSQKIIELMQGERKPQTDSVLKTESVSWRVGLYTQGRALGGCWMTFTESNTAEQMILDTVIRKHYSKSKQGEDEAEWNSSPGSEERPVRWNYLPTGQVDISLIGQLNKGRR